MTTLDNYYHKDDHTKTRPMVIAVHLLTHTQPSHDLVMGNTNMSMGIKLTHDIPEHLVLEEAKATPTAAASKGNSSSRRREKQQQQQPRFISSSRLSGLLLAHKPRR